MSDPRQLSPNLLDLDLLPPLPSALLAGRGLELLDPLRLVQPGADPGDLLDSRPPQVDRSDIATELATTNDAYGHPRARELASRLADPATRVVITGQQPGLLGGPLYTLSKAVAAARWAEELERRGDAAVALFWIATEDHDFAEVSRVTLPGSVELAHLDLGEDLEPLVPVGTRVLGPAVTDVLDEWRRLNPAESYREWIDRVAVWYRPVARFGEAFARLMVGMLGERCPLLVDSMLPSVKRAQRPFLLELIERREAVESELAAADEAIEAAGSPLQVSPQRDTSPLFLLHRGERRRIEWRGEDRFGLRGLEEFEEDVATLVATARENPAAISPGVLARPALQDAIFGTHLLLLGPGELAYLPQVAPVYRLLALEAPHVALRPQVLVLAGYERERMAELSIELDELLKGKVDPAAVVAREAGEDFVAPILRRIETELGRLQEPALALDANLEKPLEKTLAHVRRGLDTFNSKVEAAAERRHEILARRAQGLVDGVRPDGVLQERAVASAHFVGRFPDFVERLRQQLGLDPRRLHLIDPEAP